MPPVQDIYDYCKGIVQTCVIGLCFVLCASFFMVITVSTLCPPSALFIMSHKDMVTNKVTREKGLPLSMNGPLEIKVRKTNGAIGYWNVSEVEE